MNVRSVIAKTTFLQQQSTPGPLLRIQQRSRFGTLAFNTQGLAASESFISRHFQIPTWLESFLWAAPKKKTSHSKKRMRASNKGLQNKENIGTCPACGHPKLLHHLCTNCYKNIKEKAKSFLQLN